MGEDQPRREQAQGESARAQSPVELSQRLRRDAKARLDAAQRSLDEANRAFGSILNRRLEPDRRKSGSHGDGMAGPDRVEDLFHGFLDTEPQVHWSELQKGDPPNTP